jgi:hypothetical protein
MKIIQKSVTAGLTINLGNYESLRIDSTVTVEIDPGDDLAVVRARAIGELRTDLEAQYRAFNPKAKTAAGDMAAAPKAAPKGTLLD